MHSQESVQLADKHPIFDGVFWAAAVVLAVITAFSIVITGIFANSGSPTLMIAGLSIILVGPMVLLLIIVARLASRACTARGGKSSERTAMCVTTIIYCIVAPALMLGTWQCVRLLLPAPVYQEASIEMPYALPAL